ncbi:unnamed protein product, partial [Amoebophrya sp. A25]
DADEAVDHGATVARQTPFFLPTYSEEPESVLPPKEAEFLGINKGHDPASTTATKGDQHHYVEAGVAGPLSRKTRP